jgi:hypothetical protein
VIKRLCMMSDSQLNLFEVSPFMTPHICEDDLERHYLGTTADGPELATLEEHLLWCPECIDRAEGIRAYVDAIRAGLAAWV